MPDKQDSGDAKREVKDTARPSSDTNTETTRTGSAPAPQKGGPDKPVGSPPSKT